MSQHKHDIKKRLPLVSLNNFDHNLDHLSKAKVFQMAGFLLQANFRFPLIFSFGQQRLFPGKHPTRVKFLKSFSNCTCMHFDANTCKIVKNPVMKFGVGESGDFLWVLSHLLLD